MGSEPIYLLDPFGVSDRFVEFEIAEDSPNTGSSAPTCPACGLFIGPLEWLPPYNASFIMRHRRACIHVVFGHDSSELVISAEFLSFYEKARLTGLMGIERVNVVRVKPRSAQVASEYFLARVPRSRAAVDVVRSGFRPEAIQLCPECRNDLGNTTYPSSWQRLVIEPGTWSGEDIFRPRGLNVRLTSSRFRNAVMEAGFDLPFLPADKFSYSFEGRFPGIAGDEE